MLKSGVPTRLETENSLLKILHALGRPNIHVSPVPPFTHQRHIMDYLQTSILVGQGQYMLEGWFIYRKSLALDDGAFTQYSKFQEYIVDCLSWLGFMSDFESYNESYQHVQYQVERFQRTLEKNKDLLSAAHEVRDISSEYGMSPVRIDHAGGTSSILLFKGSTRFSLWSNIIEPSGRVYEA